MIWSGVGDGVDGGYELYAPLPFRLVCPCLGYARGPGPDGSGKETTADIVSTVRANLCLVPLDNEKKQQPYTTSQKDDKGHKRTKDALRLESRIKVNESGAYQDVTRSRCRATLHISAHQTAGIKYR